MAKKIKSPSLKSQKNKIRIFYVSFFSTICVVLLLWGLIKVDFQGRKISTGDKTPPFEIVRQDQNQVYFQITSMGIEKKWDISFAANSWEKIKEISNPSSKNSRE